MGRAKNAEMQSIFQSYLLYSHSFWEKTKCMVIKSMKPSATSVKKIMTPGLGDQALGWGQCGQIVKLHLIFEILFLSTPLYYMHGYEFFHQNCEIHGLWVRGLGPRVVPI